MKTINMMIEQVWYWNTVKPWHSMTLLSAQESLETETAVKKTVALYQSSTISAQSGLIMWKAMTFNLPTANGSLNLILS